MNIFFKGLGIRITEATPKEEIERLKAKYPAIKKIVESVNARDNVKATKATKETK